MGVKLDDVPDDALDELYAAEPGEFVGTRARLAKALKADGNTAAAKAIKAARKPPLAVWAVNQLARRHPEDLAALLEAGEALRRAQRKALSGVKAAGLREATEQRARAADRLTARAGAILAEQGAAPATHLPAVHTALVAAAADEDVAEALRTGRLDALPEPPSGFGDASILSLVPDMPDEHEPAPAQPAKPPKAAKPRKAAKPAGPSAGPSAAQRRALETARRTVQDAAAKAAEQAGQARDAAARLRQAEQAAIEAERRARKARREADQARRALERAQSQAEQAEAASLRAATRLSTLETETPSG